MTNITDNTKRKRFSSPPTNVQRISRFDQPPLPESRQGYGQYSSRLSTADASYSSHPNGYHFATSEVSFDFCNYFNI